MKGSNKFKQTIKDYLEKRGSLDPLFAKIVMKPGKNMDDCITYILNTVQKSDINGFTDDEIYGMAIHYFDEDNIDIGGSSRDMRVVVNHHVDLTQEEIAEAKEKAINDIYKEERERVARKQADENEKAQKAQEKAEAKKQEKIEKSKGTIQTLF